MFGQCFIFLLEETISFIGHVSVFITTNISLKCSKYQLIITTYYYQLIIIKYQLININIKVGKLAMLVTYGLSKFPVFVCLPMAELVYLTLFTVLFGAPNTQSARQTPKYCFLVGHVCCIVHNIPQYRLTPDGV
jgi:hypothetical protein